MSLRQIRRVKELNEKAPDLGPVGEEEEEVVVPQRRTVFQRISLEDDSSSSSSEEEPQPPSISSPVIKTAKPPKVSKTSVREKKPPKITDAVVAPVKKTFMDPSVKIDIRMLNPASELRRIFGSAVGGSRKKSSSIISKRRHWLIDPSSSPEASKNWPLVVRDSFKMELCRDGSFRLVPESDYEAKMKILSRIVVSHDLDALYQFIQFNPFHVHGLIQLALILIDQRKEFENAYELIRRALFAFQSAFLPSFHPEKSLLLSQDSVFTSTLLRCLLLYGHLLAGQGCLRTSLEVYKLIYLMEGGMATGCPSTHILLHLDSAATRADQFDFLSQFAITNGLADAIPGTALLYAIAQKKRGIDLDDFSTISYKDVRKELTATTPATVALVRAIVKFPGVIRLVLGREIDGISRPADVLTNKLIQAFASKILAYVKTQEEIVQWAEAVVSDLIPRLVKGGNLHSLTVHPRRDWLESGYGNLTISEFEWGQAASTNFTEPAVIIEQETQIMEIYCEDTIAVPRAANPGLAHPVSLDSNPLAVFFQTLLPWSQIDHTGTQSTPLTVRGLLEHLNSSTPADQVIMDGSGDSEESSEDYEEEIDME